MPLEEKEDDQGTSAGEWERGKKKSWFAKQHIPTVAAACCQGDLEQSTSETGKALINSQSGSSFLFVCANCCFLRSQHEIEGNNEEQQQKNGGKKHKKGKKTKETIN